MRVHGALLLALACLAASLAAAQVEGPEFCANTAPAGTGEKGFWEMLPEGAEVPEAVRDAVLKAFADERAGNASAPVEEEGDVMQQEWPDCLAEDLLVDVEGCSLVEQAGGERWELRLNLTCTSEDYVDHAVLEALVEAAPDSNGTLQVEITADPVLDLDPSRAAAAQPMLGMAAPEEITVGAGSALMAGDPTAFAAGGCGLGAHLLADGVTCAPCTRVGCSDCRICQPFDPAGSCVDLQYCVGICRTGYYTNNQGSCLPCRPGCSDCQTCQGEPGCFNGFCTACVPPLVLSNGNCVAQCPPGCATCNGQRCTSCKSGFYPSVPAGTCLSCAGVIPGCATCERCRPEELNSKWCHSGVKCMGCLAQQGWVPSGDGTQRCKRV